MIIDFVIVICAIIGLVAGTCCVTNWVAKKDFEKEKTI